MTEKEVSNGLLLMQRMANFIIENTDVECINADTDNITFRYKDGRVLKKENKGEIDVFMEFLLRAKKI